MYPMPGPYAQDLYQPAPPGGGGGGDGGLGYGTAPRWWFDGEYLLWFSQGAKLQYPLLTTSAPSDQGVLGAASTNVLVGQRKLGFDAFNGFRLTAGFFGDADRRVGFQMTGFTTETQVNSQKFGGLDNSKNLPVLARPFIDVAGAQSTIVLSGPGIGPARVRVGTTSQTWSVEPEGVWNLYRAEPGSRFSLSVNLLAGYRFIEFHESLTISSTTQFNGGTNTFTLPTFTTGPFGIVSATGVTVVSTSAFTNFGGVRVNGPAAIDIRDSFRTTNQFNGAVFGLSAEGRYGIITASSFAKVGLGNMHERVEISGSGAYISGTCYGGEANIHVQARQRRACCYSACGRSRTVLQLVRRGAKAALHRSAKRYWPAVPHRLYLKYPMPSECCPATSAYPMDHRAGS